MSKGSIIAIRIIQLGMLLLGALFVALGVNAALSAKLVESAVQESSPEPSQKDEAEAASSEDEISVLAYNRNLFNQSAEPAEIDLPQDLAAGSSAEEQGAEEQAPLAESELEMELLGTMVADDPRWSVAHLRAKASQEDHYSHIGDLMGEAELVRIERTFVLLRRPDKGNKLEFIPLLGSAHGAAQAQRVYQEEYNSSEEISQQQIRRMGRSELYQVPEGMIREGEDGTIFVNREVIEHQASTARKLADDLELQPIAAGGELQGFRLGQVPQGTLFAGGGMRPGDVIVEINGTAPRDEESAMRFVEDLAQKGEVIVEIDRRGQREKLRFQAE